MCTLIQYLGFMDTFFFNCLVGCFEHDCLDTCYFGCLISRVPDQNGISQA